jgi:hypothetical protein
MKGTVILLLENNPALITYEIISDEHWKTRSVKISQQTSHNKIRNIDLLIDQEKILEKKY